jgi:hypothetical protein
VLINLPNEHFDQCDITLITPQGSEVGVGSGGCAAGALTSFDPRFQTEPVTTYTPTGELTTFVSYLNQGNTQYGKLSENYGTWRIKVLVRKGASVWNTLTTSFNYGPYASVESSCVLQGETEKDCLFLGEKISVARGPGCGPTPVPLTITFRGKTYPFNLVQGEKGTFPDSQSGYAISVRNNSSPCSVAQLTVQFDRELMYEVMPTPKVPTRVEPKAVVTTVTKAASLAPQKTEQAKVMEVKEEAAQVSTEESTTSPESPSRLFGIFTVDGSKSHWWSIFVW